MNNWETQYTFSVCGCEGSIFQSKRTGLKVSLADIEGPLVNAYFVLATEALDDDGLPHTLEHFVFLGSEQFPYKGVLDTVANRCLAQGTNAWTDVDHTAYTITTAGEDGFLQLLPVYLDHVLYPTLTDAGFVTEIHHIDGEGNDAGVVYSEMQARENTGPSRMHRRMLHLLYPGVCGFKSETGGIMANLRALDAGKVRRYHRTFYRPDNLCLIITGKVEQARLFASLDQVEERILAKGELPPMRRPWSDPVPPFVTSSEEHVDFPSEDETTGMVHLAWRGPDYRDFETVIAIGVLWRFLVESAVSPVRKTFVEIDDPYCTDVQECIIENKATVQFLIFKNVPMKMLELIKDKFFTLLADILKEGVDMNKMAHVLHRYKLKRLDDMEQNPHITCAMGFIGYFLYGEHTNDLKTIFSFEEALDRLATRGKEFWEGLMKRYLVDAPCVCLKGRPSATAAKELAAEEELRLAEQRNALGEERMKQLEEELEEAIQKNEVEVPEAMVAQFSVPDVSRIPLIPVSTYRTDGSVVSNLGTDKVKGFLAKDASDACPVLLQFDHIKSNFVQLTAVLHTEDLPTTLRPYLELYLETIFDSPIKRRDSAEVLDHTTVVTELTKDTVEYSNSLGFGGGNFVCGPLAQSLVLELKLEIHKYEKGIQWLQDFLWNSVFETERLRISASKLVNDVAQHKRSGRKMATAGLREMNFQPHTSNHSVTNLMRQQKFLGMVLERLEKNPSSVLDDMDKFRNILCHPSNLLIQVATNMEKLSHPMRPWVDDFLRNTEYHGKTFIMPRPMQFSCELLSDNARMPTGKGYVINLPAIESGFLFQSAQGPTQLDDPDVPVLIVLVEYLCGMEGPFWRQIRGQGLAYSYGISAAVDEGLLYFYLARSASLLKAYQESLKIITRFLDQEEHFNELALESSRATSFFNIIAKEETVPLAAQQSLMRCLYRVDVEFSKQQLIRLKEVTLDDLKRVLDKYFGPLFASTSNSFCCTINPTKAEDLIAGLHQQCAKPHVTHVPSVDDFFV